MTHYKKYVVAIIPANRLAEANALLKKHGYGDLFFREACVRKNDQTTAAPTHYVVEVAADPGMAAVMQLVAKKVAGAKLESGSRTADHKKTKKAAFMEKEGVKPKAEAKAIKED